MRARAATVALIMAAGAASAQPQASSVSSLSASLEEITRRVSPAVVQIFAEGYGTGAGGTSLLGHRQVTGSGVLLDAEGTVVTNAHVVAGARRIQVLVPPPESRPTGRSSILRESGKLRGALIIGTDEETDLAVLRVPETDLPFLELGDSEGLRQGQIVFAFGSPRGLTNSMSMGVISSTARQLGPDDPMIYIQTDATINPGNSGGPLVDTSGRVIGINTLILSESGGSEGIGFAAPSNIVRNVVEQIRTTGHVRRGEIGANAQTITPLLGQALGLGRTWGVILGDVRPGGPADRAGLRIGDVVVALDGKVMENGRQFDVNLYGKPIGQHVTLEVIRSSASRMFDVAVVQRRDDGLRFADLVTPERNLVEELGILAVELDADLRKLLPPLRERTGVLVAARAVNATPGVGFQPGDVIHEANGHAVGTLRDLRAVLGEVPGGDPVAVLVERTRGTLYITVQRR